MDNEHQAAAPADELDQARASLLAQTAPPAAEPVDALRVLAELDAEADGLYAPAERGTPAALDEIAEYRRRRLAQGHPQFEAKARAELAGWRATEAAMITAAAAAGSR